MATTAAQFHAVLVRRPNGFRDIRIGPISSPHDADVLAAGLRWQINQCAHLPGTTVTTDAYRPDLAHWPLIPTGHRTTVQGLDTEEANEDSHAHFPDLYALLRAEYSDQEAASLWEQASRIHDLLHATKDDDRDQARPQDPITVTWADQVDTPHDPTKPTVVHLVLDDGRPVHLHLDEEHREALGLMLVDPSLPGVETDDPHPLRNRTARRPIRLRRRIRIR
ncbi:hypothetical protein [Kitasatospora sp. NPDC058478]|uniref:hypothetical protein n=1 Tax=unclassified Kitasatospora TaxID=2633591 RepID=UPI00365293B8